MALTGTLITGAVTAAATTVKLSAFTNPASGNISPKTMLQFATGERCLVTDVTNSPTLGVVRGYAGTTAVAHSSLEGVQYALVSDPEWPNLVQYQTRTLPNAVSENIQVVTITGATGTTAAPVLVPAPAFLNCTGTSGAGLNLPIPNVGDVYEVKNNTTGVCNVYCVGGTINATTGTTANAITATGTLTSIYRCSVSGTWSVSPLSQ